MKGTSPSRASRNPCRQGLQSISQEAEVISLPLNLVAYPDEIWLVSGSLPQHFVRFDYGRTGQRIWTTGILCH